MAQALEDGTQDFSLGQDSWHRPDRIQAAQYAKGVNLSTRGGVVSPRPAFHQHLPVFENKTLKTAFGQRTIQDIWNAGKFQAAIPFVSGSNGYIVTIMCGLFFKTSISTWKTYLLSETIKVNQYAPRINWSFAGEFVVVFDYPDRPVIISGDTVRRSSATHTFGGQPQPEVPISVLGTYNQNRLFIGNDGVDFTAGDAVGNLATPEAPITFTETLTPSSPFYLQKFALSAGEQQYPISAMGFIQELDQNTGIGPMFVATRKKFYFYNTNQPRAQWDQGQFGGVLIANAGIAGPRAFANVNSDLIFVSADYKIHALSTSRNEAQKWGNVPISREVDNYLPLHDPALSQFAVVGYFDNRIYISANPYRMECQDRDGRPISDYAHGGFVPIEIENLASFLTQGTPTWPGLWTGVSPMEILEVNERCFVISKDGCGPSGENAFYEIRSDKTTDLTKIRVFDTTRNRKRTIKSILYTKQYQFQSDFVFKKLHTIALHMQDIRGDFKVRIDYKVQHSDEWLEYFTWAHNAPDEECGMPGDDILNGIGAHQFREIIFGDPKVGGCNPVSDDDYQIFDGIQLRLTIEGEYWFLQDIKLQAELFPLQERQDTIYCRPLPKVLVGLQCDPDWFLPEETLCP